MIFFKCPLLQKLDLAPPHVAPVLAHTGAKKRLQNREKKKRVWEPVFYFQNRCQKASTIFKKKHKRSGTGFYKNKPVLKNHEYWNRFF